MKCSATSLICRFTCRRIDSFRPLYLAGHPIDAEALVAEQRGELRRAVALQEQLTREHCAAAAEPLFKELQQLLKLAVGDAGQLGEAGHDDHGLAAAVLGLAAEDQPPARFLGLRRLRNG